MKEIKQLKALAVRGAEAEQTVKQQVNTIELQKAQITSLERQLRPSIQKRLKEAQELSDLKDENMALEYELNRQKDGETDAASGGCADLLGGEAAGTVSAICPAGKGAYYAGAQAGAQA